QRAVHARSLIVVASTVLRPEPRPHVWATIDRVPDVVTGAFDLRVRVVRLDRYERIAKLSHLESGNIGVELSLELPDGQRLQPRGDEGGHLRVGGGPRARDAGNAQVGGDREERSELRGIEIRDVVCRDATEGVTRQIHSIEVGLLVGR